MLGKNPSRRASSRSARLSSSISHTVSTRQQRPLVETSLNKSPSLLKTPRLLKNSQRKIAKAPKLRLPNLKLTSLEYTLLGIIGASCLCVIASFIAVANFDPVRDAETAFATLADDYYIEFLYPRVLGSHINNPSAILARYSEDGLPSVRLSQILLYNNASHASYESYFNNKYYYCDAGHSYFNFYPVAPYGPRDYTVEYSTSCEKML